MVTSKERNTCTGCTACVNVCPKNCITMDYDEQGFLYPHIDQRLCIECSACDKVCEQAARSVTQTSGLKGFGAVAKNKELQSKSSSGGVFTLLCDEVLSRQGVVFGVAMADNNRTAEHRAATNEDELSPFRGAKYLQSSMGDCFKRVRGLLDEGKEVLFSGTPCQVDGLKACIKENDDNLLCVDIVCHGVPSPMIWRKYCDEIEGAYRGGISTVNFRHKKYSWEKPHVDCNENCTVVFRSKTEDPYMRLFLQDYTLRPSCYECQHKGMNRKSDITIADFWGVDKIIPGFSNGAGTSLVIIHTEKGRKYFEAIMDKVQVQETDVKKALEFNGAALRSARKPERLEEFWKELVSSKLEKLADKYAPGKDELKTKIKQTPLYGFLKKGKKVNMENGICFVIDRNICKKK